MTLTCYCCRQNYERGRFRCCAPPKNMSAFKWQETWCRVEIAEGVRCNRCPRCGCPHRASTKYTGSEIGWNSVSDIAPTFQTRGDVKQFVERWSPHNS